MSEIVVKKSPAQRLGGFIKKNVVMVVALVLALVTCFFVPPDEEYIGYFDFKTLTCLFCVLAVVCALRNMKFFFSIARRLVERLRNIRATVLGLVYITFLGSMLIANDMALLTFLPLGYLCLTVSGKQKYMCFTFIMQNIAANLGGMLTPFGNPQNLYIYTKYNIPTLEFMMIMAPPFIVAVIAITVCCLVFVKNEPIVIDDTKVHLTPWRVALYLVLFALAIIIVFRVIPYWIGLVIIPVVLFFADKKALAKVDYPLLFTFVFFFIFAGNMGRMDVVRDFFSSILDKNTLLVSALSCQFISNVPSAILLSQFTDNYPDLLVGVNIGGTGTLIASLASLITFREYVKNNPGKAGYYVLRFSLFNFAFLGGLLAFMTFWNTLFPVAP